jgi:hypothetical protein
MSKKYSINWQDGKVVSVEVNGKQYKSPDDVPDPEDQFELEMLMSRAGDVDFAEPARDPLTRFILILFLGIGVLMLAISVIAAVFTVRSFSREVSARGNVVDFVVRTDSEGQEYYYPVVEFTLPDGSMQNVQLSTGSWPPAYIKGEAVTVLYDQEKPQNARIQSFSGAFDKWILSMITGFLGIVFVGVSLFVGWLFYKDTNKGSKRRKIENAP